MTKGVIFLDVATIALGACVLIATVRTHGMRATVHLVRRCVFIMALFTFVQMRWTHRFDIIEGQEVLDDFMDVHNTVALTFSFYVMSILVLSAYSAYERWTGRVSSATETAQDRDAPLV